LGFLCCSGFCFLGFLGLTLILSGPHLEGSLLYSQELHCLSLGGISIFYCLEWRGMLPLPAPFHYSVFVSLCTPGSTPTAALWSLGSGFLPFLPPFPAAQAWIYLQTTAACRFLSLGLSLWEVHSVLQTHCTPTLGLVLFSAVSLPAPALHCSYRGLGGGPGESCCCILGPAGMEFLGVPALPGPADPGCTGWVHCCCTPGMLGSGRALPGSYCRFFCYLQMLWRWSFSLSFSPLCTL